MKALNDLTFEKMQEEFEKIGLKRYRAEQVFRWTANGAFSFDEMSNISKELKDELKEKYILRSVEIERRYQSEMDSTRKFLIKMDDGEMVESVLMEYKHGYSVCVSTQVGCLMGCKFCASTLNGKKRDLFPSEILGQITEIQKSENIKISNIVLMGIGEPLDNYENIMDFLRIVNHHLGLNTGIRHISVSTCGLVDKINKIAEENLGIALSISLHATTDEVRSKLMPINKKYGLNELIPACREYCEKTRRRISFEYILINDLNDNYEDAVRLAKMLDGITEHVNLIPVNDIGKGLMPSTKERRLQFRDWLMKMGVNTTIRRTLGSDISASCGQLRGEFSH